MLPIFPCAPDFCLFASTVSTDGSLIGNLIAMIALCAMEIVLGIDNSVFLSVLLSKLTKEQQTSACGKSEEVTY